MALPGMIPQLILVRHGETPWNVEGRLQGQHDIPMNARGEQQAESVGRFLARHRPEAKEFDFVSSPLGRTRRTMELMRGAMGLDPFAYRLDERLKEITFGDWEGLTWPEVEKADPARAAQRIADKWGFVPPQGESYAMLAERVTGFVQSLTVPTVAVAHGGVARALFAVLAGEPPQIIVNRDIHQGRALLFENGAARWL